MSRLWRMDGRKIQFADALNEQQLVRSSCGGLLQGICSNPKLCLVHMLSFHPQDVLIVHINVRELRRDNHEMKT